MDIGATDTDAISRRITVVLLAVLVGAMVGALVMVSGGRAAAQDSPSGPGPAPVAPLPLTPIPVTPIPVTPIPGTAAPVLPVPAPDGSSGGGGRRYVALGDSWAAGTAAGIDPASGTCRRSVDAYPALVGPRLVGPAWVSRACASTRSGPNTQFDALGPDTAVVTVTVGADATGLGAHARACGSGGDVVACDVSAARVDRALAALPAALDASLAELRGRAPGARVVVTGYPLPAEGLACLTGPADTDRARRLDDTVARLDAVLADRTRAAGLTFVDVRPAFAGHGLCAADPWLTSASGTDPLLAGGATALGHALGLVGPVESAVAAPVPSAAPVASAAALPSVPADPLADADPVAPRFTQLPSRAVDGLLQPLFGG